MPTSPPPNAPPTPTPNVNTKAKHIVAGVIVAGTWAVWAYQSVQGLPIHDAVFVLVLVIVLASIRGLYGPGALSKALDAVSALGKTAETLQAQTQDDDEDADSNP